MRLLRYLILFCIAVIGGSVSAQSQRELGQLMRERGEYYFTLNIDDLTELQNLGDLCSVDGIDGRNVICYANQQEYDKLLSLGLQPVLQTPPSLRANVTMWDGQGTYNWNCYLTYPQYMAMMDEFPSKALSDRTCEKFSLGTLSTSSHRQLLGVHIYKGEPQGKPKFLYSSTMHGDEVTGMILMLRLIDELCTSTDSRIVNLLNDVDIYILPLTNPDGTYYGGNSTVGKAIRYNGNYKDLNRNYKDSFNGAHPDGNSYQEETQWTMAFADEHLFTMGANYHGGSEVMNYPWDWVFQDHADLDWWEYVCTEYVTLARQINSSYMGGYNYGSNNYDYDGVTNGATWYSITGSRQDYMNGYAQCREVTVECSTTKTVAGSSLPTYWTYHHNCMLTLMEQARNGVHGVVYDAATGQTLQGVTVSVLNHDIHNSYVTTHSVGDFHRPIKGGTYTFVFDKEGYARKFVEVTVADGQRVDLTVNLTPTSATPMVCFEQVNAASIVTGPCLMGYRNSNTLVMPTHNNTNTSTSVSVSATSLSVTPTDAGFTLPYNSEPERFALEPSGTNGQYHIVYKGRMLQRSSNSLVWAKPSNAFGNGVSLTSYRWYVNANGIYQQSGSTKYYLNYSNGSFTTSTTNQNNITFYRETECLPQPIQQMSTLYQGWNWWSTNLDITLSDFETALGTSGINILSQSNGSVDYLYDEWEGDFSELDFTKMYEVNVAELVEVTLSGIAIDPNQLTITLNPNWNWIGYPVQTSMDVNNALSDLSPAIGDIIKSKNSGVSMYTGSSWIGVLNTLEPGQGYMYYSTATDTTTFTYPANGRGSAKASMRSENNHWKPVSARFANNMTVLAVVDLEGNEAIDESIEVGAFVGDECRGSVRLMHVDATDRYMAFMTVHGENGEQVSFKVLDGDVEREVRETLEFHVNGILGGLNAPYVLHVGGSSLVLFPNPVERGKAICLDMPAGSEPNDVKVEVYNALGSLVRSEILNGVAALNGLPTAGVYTVKVTERNGNVHFVKLVVR